MPQCLESKKRLWLLNPTGRPLRPLYPPFTVQQLCEHLKAPLSLFPWTYKPLRTPLGASFLLRPTNRKQGLQKLHIGYGSIGLHWIQGTLLLSEKQSNLDRSWIFWGIRQLPLRRQDLEEGQHNRSALQVKVKLKRKTGSWWWDPQRSHETVNSKASAGFFDSVKFLKIKAYQRDQRHLEIALRWWQQVILILSDDRTFLKWPTQPSTLIGLNNQH